MTVRLGEPFDLGRAVSDVEALLAAPVPGPGQTTVDRGDPVSGEWAGTDGDGFRIVPLWESADFTGLYDPEWNQAAAVAQEHLAFLVHELDRKWGPHRTVGMRVAVFRRHRRGRPLPVLHQTLTDRDLLGDLTVWDLAADRCLALSLSQSDGDAPMILAAVLSTRPVTEPPE
ncbi:hypothetical protein [Streptomyces sp. B93]|uniref:hypothetical protein n=1 Tax=Streptomyces sp. B93 TaxID=2824875 RepID=UPI001B383FBE|nr:hypothetical protein [Streptomyces sp. B93]MBQ1094069.1 hypothetical protein [Streptomyces sp. B93]